MVGSNNNNNNNNNHDQYAGESSPFLLNNYVVDVERRKRSRLCIALTTFAITTALVAATVVWSAHLRAEERLANRSSYLAALAKLTLNSRLKTQSDKIAEGCESTLLLIRHCEKIGPHVTDSEGNVHCSYLGFERAKYIATLFGDNAGERWPAPQHLFALTPDRGYHWNFREWETLYPLSKKLDIQIDITQKDSFVGEFFDLLQTGNLCGKVSVASWKREYIGELAPALSCGPDDGCPLEFPEDSFDEVWQLKFVFNAIDDSKQDTKDESELLHENNSSTEEEEGDIEATAATTGSTNSTDDIETRFRLLKKKRIAGPGWSVYGTVSQQYFDPLSFSKLAGDYPEGGTKKGGRWADEF